MFRQVYTLRRMPLYESQAPNSQRCLSPALPVSLLHTTKLRPERSRQAKRVSLDSCSPAMAQSMPFHSDRRLALATAQVIGCLVQERLRRPTRALQDCSPPLELRHSDSSAGLRATAACSAALMQCICWQNPCRNGPLRQRRRMRLRRRQLKQRLACRLSDHTGRLPVATTLRPMEMWAAKEVTTAEVRWPRTSSPSLAPM
jgi:hypothetical protein